MKDAWRLLQPCLVGKGRKLRRLYAREWRRQGLGDRVYYPHERSEHAW